MKAAWYEQCGPAREVIQLGEMETPTAGRGEVRVRVHASGVNPSDVKKRAGSRGGMQEARVIPHSDGAGVIGQVGPGVEASRVGQRVWLYNGQWERPYGTAAEYIILPATQAIPLPDSVSFAEGACLGIPAMTAHRCLFAEGAISGQTILVTGGAGAVGHYAVQLAKWGGATVITTISSDQKAAHAQQAGADHIINYHSEDVSARIQEITGGHGVDRIVEVDFGRNLPVTLAVLWENGTVATYASMSNPQPTLHFYALMLKNINLRLFLVYRMPETAKQQACRDIGQALAENHLSHAFAARFPLEQLIEAHEAVESGTLIGNVVVEIE
jgi:NADPH2:quinone reductase